MSTPTPPSNNGIEAIIARVEALEQAAAGDVISGWEKVDNFFHRAFLHIRNMSQSAAYLSVAAFVVKMWYHIV